MTNSGQFQKGNKLAAGKREQPFAQMLRIAIKEAGKAKGTTKLRDVADMLVTEAVNGNIQAIKELADRLDGKPHQSVAVGGDPEGAPLLSKVVVEHVKSTDDNG